MPFASCGTYCYILQTLTQIEGEKQDIFTKGRQDTMKAIEISRLSQVRHPIATPAGVVEKRFKAVLRDYLQIGTRLELEIQLRDAHESNGNRIVVERFHFDQTDSNSLGVTGEILRKIAVQKLAEECVLAAIDFFYPKTKSIKKSLRKVPSAADVSRTELVALTSLSLGRNPSAKDIQDELNRQGVSLEEGTIRNYLTKAKKSGLMDVTSNIELPEVLKGFTPDSMSVEADLIGRLLAQSQATGLAPVSPLEHRKLETKANDVARNAALKKAQINKLIRDRQLSKKNSSKSIPPKRKEGK